MTSSCHNISYNTQINNDTGRTWIGLFNLINNKVQQEWNIGSLFWSLFFYTCFTCMSSKTGTSGRSDPNTVMWHEHHDSSNHQQVNCLVKNSFRSNIKEHIKAISITGVFDGNPSVTHGFPLEHHHATMTRTSYIVHSLWSASIT